MSPPASEREGERASDQAAYLRHGAPPTFTSGFNFYAVVAPSCPAALAPRHPPPPAPRHGAGAGAGPSPPAPRPRRPRRGAQRAARPPPPRRAPLACRLVAKSARLREGLVARGESVKGDGMDAPRCASGSSDRLLAEVEAQSAYKGLDGKVCSGPLTA